MRSTKFTLASALLLAGGLIVLNTSIAHADSFVINGMTYTTSSAENLTAAFTTPDAGITTQSYSGFVEIMVSGTGQSAGTTFNDAFYLIDGSNNSLGADGSYYQLTLDTKPLVGLNPAQDAKNFIAYDVTTGTEVTAPYVPAYNPNHTYDFIVNASLLTPNLGQLHFGVADGQYNDNSGTYNLTVKQIAPVPEPGSIALLVGMGISGAGFLARRRKNARKAA